jgi:hypothetical protein
MLALLQIIPVAPEHLIPTAIDLKQELVMLQTLKRDGALKLIQALGSGKVVNHHCTGSSTIKNNLFYIQPAISASSAKRTLEFAVVSRPTGVNFKVTDTSFNTAREPYNKSQLQTLQNKPFHIIWEPGFVFRFGWQKVLFEVGYSYSEDLSNSSLNISDYTFSFGTSLPFNVSKNH